MSKTDHLSASSRGHNRGMKKRDAKRILARHCPTCGAKPGAKCELNTGQPRNSPHLDRRLGFEVMDCEEKAQLINAYAASTEQLAIAASRLRAKTGAEFAEALRASELARAECGKARRGIEEHRNEHCC